MKLGPVNREVYCVLSVKKAEHLMVQDVLNNQKISNLDSNVLNEQIVYDIELVWNFYKDINPFDLVNESHKENSPWHKHYVEGEKITIPKHNVEEYYKQYLILLEGVYKKILG